MRKLVLIVDDDGAWRKVLARTLEQDGYEVLEAEDGDVGLKICAAERPALVITDVFMPERDGFEILSALRDAEHRPKILAMSGSSTEGALDFLVVASRLGADHALKKPFSPDELRTAVQALIGAPDKV